MVILFTPKNVIILHPPHKKNIFLWFGFVCFLFFWGVGRGMYIFMTWSVNYWKQFALKLVTKSHFPPKTKWKLIASLEMRSLMKKTQKYILKTAFTKPPQDRIQELNWALTFIKYVDFIYSYMPTESFPMCTWDPDRKL